MNKIKMILATIAVVGMIAVATPAQSSVVLRDTGGRSVALDQLRGRVVVLFFGGILDPQSPEELPVLQRLANRYEGRGVDVYWVSLDDRTVPDTQLTDFAGRYGFRGLVLRDTSGDALKSFSSGRRAQLPTIVILDPAGAVADRPIGGFDPESDLVNRLAAIIDPLLR